MGDLFWNKIAAVVLATLLVVMGLREVSSIVFSTEAPDEIAYPVDMSALLVAGADDEEIGPVDFGTLLATASADAGERVARRCVACHTFDQDGGHGTGPALYGVLGRDVAAVAGFSFSSAMRDYAEGGTEWLYQNMYEYLENPRRYVPGTSMAFAGLRSQDDRIDLLAYMRQQDDNPPPLPEPLPEDETTEEVVDAEDDTGPVAAVTGDGSTDVSEAEAAEADREAGVDDEPAEGLAGTSERVLEEAEEDDEEDDEEPTEG